MRLTQSAGRCIWLTRKCEYLEALGVAMGVFEEAHYAEETVMLAGGDVLVLYTDGITKVINTEEEAFGEEQLEELVMQQASRPAQELAELIIKAVAAFSQDQGAFDDETLVMIKRSPLPQWE